MKNLEKTVNQVQKRIEACLASNGIFDKIGNNSRTSQKENQTASKDMGFPTDFINFRRMIGNPYSKVLDKVQDMAPFQEDYHNAIQEFHWVIPLKSRKIGATDTAITSFALNCFDRYTGHDVMIVAGNELRIAKEILLRFYEFFTDKHHEDGFYAFRQIEPEYLDAGYTWQESQKKGQKIFYNDLIKSARLSQDPVIEFNNGARVFAFAASKQEKAQTFRGTDDVIAILVSEAAHTGMKNDQPIMNALEPNLAQRDDADFVLESTGNGRRGFYFKYWIQIMEMLAKQFNMRVDNHQSLVDKLHRLWHDNKIAFELDWFPLMWDYKVGIKEGIISEKLINREKRNVEIDFAQEYCYDKETEVLTENGFKLFKNIKKHEKLASLNVESGNIEYYTPIRHISYHYKGKMILLENKWNNACITPNHKMLVYNSGGYWRGKKYEGNFNFIDAENLKKHHKFYRSAKWVGDHKCVIKIGSVSVTMNDFCVFMGYWLSEGHVTHIGYENRDSYVIGISQHKQENLKKIITDLETFPFKFNIQKNSIIFRNRELAEYLRQFGKSFEKYIPFEILNTTPENIKIFLDAFCLGDGTKRSQQSKS